MAGDRPCRRVTQQCLLIVQRWQADIRHGDRGVVGRLRFAWVAPQARAMVSVKGDGTATGADERRQVEQVTPPAARCALCGNGAFFRAPARTLNSMNLSFETGSEWHWKHESRWGSASSPFE